MKKIKSNYIIDDMLYMSKGITLITLVVSIIVLLILSTVTLNLLLGDNNLLDRAYKTEELYNNKKKEEEETLKQLAEFIDNFSNKENNISSLFIWNVDSVSVSSLKIVVDYLKINTIYCHLSEGDFSNFNFQILSEFSYREGIDLYILDGEAEGMQESYIQDTKNLITNISNYNKENRSKVVGLSLDLEFYLSNEFKNGNDEEKLAIFDRYVDLMKEYYSYAKNNNLKFTVCIPTWLETIDNDNLEDLIYNACDYVQVMNYNKTTMIEDIKNEVKIAKKANKPIENIAELQKPQSDNNVTDDITFYNDGIIECIKKFKEIKDKYSYSKLGFSYHYYNPVKDLILEETTVEDKYVLELYPYNKGTSVKIENAYLQSGDDIHYALSAQFDDLGEYILEFYDLTFDKEYKLVIEDEEYVIDLDGDYIVNYPYSSDKKKYYDSLNITNKMLYSLELYPYENGNSIEIKNAYLISGEEIHYGIPRKTDNSNEYIINFTDLTFDKEYILVIEDENYETDTIIYYPYSTETTKYYKEVILKTKNKYSLEIYGRFGDEKVIIQSGKLKSQNNELVGEIINLEDGSNLLYFNKLDYNTEYILEIYAEGFQLAEPKTYIYNLQDGDYFVSFIDFNKK